MPNDFVLAILDVNVAECDDYDVEELIVDCARDRRINCGGMTSCVALNRSVDMMLNKTFMSRDMAFRFYSENLEYNTMTGETLELFDVSYNGCSENSDNQGSSGWAAITLHPFPGEVYIYMNVCYQ